MTFLAPIPAIIAGAIAAPALLLFYFLRLRRTPVRVSSTLLWVQATRDLQVNVPFRMIRPSWLLVLQLLILASLLLALARPALHMDAAPGGRAVILIDRSASMSARDGVGGARGETRLDEAKRRALMIADRLGRSGGTQVMVVSYAADARALTGFTADRAAVREAIRGVAPSDQPDNLGRALDLVSAAGLGASDGPEEDSRGARMLVVLVSDGGTPAPAGLAVADAAWQFEGVGPAPGPAGAPALDNVGVAAISARRDYRDPATVRVFARIVNGGATAVSAVVALSVDGRVVERRAVEVAGSTGPAASQTGEASASFEFQDAGGGVVVASIGRADILAADDAGAVVLSAPRRPGVLLVAPERAGTTGPGWLIGDVLAEMDLGAFGAVSAVEYERLAAGGGLGPYSLVVFDRVRPERLPPVASISFGAGLPGASGPPAPAADGLARSDTEITGGRFVSWERAHPVLRDVSLDSVVVGRAIGLPGAIEQGGVAGKPERVVTELARGEGGPLIELVEDGPVRRVVVGFELAQSNWPLAVGFPIFLSNAVDYLTLRGQGDAGLAFTTAEAARVRVGADAEAEVTLRGPGGGAARVAVEPGAAAVTVGVLERAGVYTVEGAGGGGDRAVAVNVASGVESAVRTSRAVVVGGRTVASAADGAGPREVWPWFIVAAAVLLAAEWFIHAAMMRV